MYESWLVKLTNFTLHKTAPPGRIASVEDPAHVQLPPHAEVYALLDLLLHFSVEYLYVIDTVVVVVACLSW